MAGLMLGCGGGSSPYGSADAELESSAPRGCIVAGAADEAAPSCDHAAATPTASDEDHFGAPFTLPDPAPLAVAVAQAVDGRPVQVEGVVDAVCQKRGCWMVLRDGAAHARVLMKDHAFAVPVDARGKRARVEGVLERRTFSPAQVQHLEEDAGRSGASVTGPRTEHVLTASAVRFEG